MANLLTYPDAIDSWTAANVTVTADQDGVADRVNDASAAQTGNVTHPNVTNVPAGSVAVSFRIDKNTNTTRYPAVTLTADGTVAFRVRVNTQTGATAVVEGAASVTMTDEGAGYWLVRCVGTIATGAIVSLRFQPAPRGDNIATVLDQTSNTGSALVKNFSLESLSGRGNGRLSLGLGLGL